jgi:hypothetical protein
MRRGALRENFLVSLPSYAYDMFRISRRYSNLYGYGTNILPFNAVKSSSDIAFVPTDSWTTPGFDTVEAFDAGFPSSPLIIQKGDAFYNNSFTFNFKPIIMEDGTSSSHQYELFNRLIHRCIIQPGIIVMPYMYDSTNNLFNKRTYGPALLSSAEIGGSENGGVSISTQFEGSTAVSGKLSLSSSTVKTAVETPSRFASSGDVIILIGDDCHPYFDLDNMFQESRFESAAELSGGALGFDIDRPIKRVLSWKLSVKNTFKKDTTMPSQTKPYGNGISQEDFSSSDQAGTRYFTLEQRRIGGEITFLTDALDNISEEDLENQFLKDNNETLRMILSIAPNYHFPLTNVQFAKGEITYESKKAVRVKYKFVARLASNANLSLNTSGHISSPTSEFGYAYSLGTNDFLNV